jgi:ubiquinol-cytochrome c reductase cytochrome c1 subunit
MTTIKTTLMGFAAGLLLSIAPAVAAEQAAAGHEARYEIPRQTWTWGGMFGYFDQQQLRRGFKVYKEVCMNCHNIGLVSYRNLGEPGGPNFSPEEVKAIAAEVQVFEGFDEQGNVAMRAGRPADNFVWKFKNAKEASAAFGGAVPPDLSLITRARGIEREFHWYQYPLIAAKDLATQYQEQGADYVHALMTGYVTPPAGKTVADGLNYNPGLPWQPAGHAAAPVRRAGRLCRRHAEHARPGNPRRGGLPGLGCRAASGRAQEDGHLGHHLPGCARRPSARVEEGSVAEYQALIRFAGSPAWMPVAFGRGLPADRTRSTAWAADLRRRARHPQCGGKAALPL